MAQGVIVDEMGASLDELEAIYRSSLPRFRRVAAAIVGDRERACDVVQDAFGTAIRKRRSFRGSGPLEAWVWRLVVNEARDQVRPFELPLEELPARPEARTNGGGANAREELRVAVALLPEPSGSCCSFATTPTSTTRQSPTHWRSRRGQSPRR